MKRGVSGLSNKERKYLRYIERCTQEYIKYLEHEERRLPSAKRLGLNKCQRCGYCCLSIICVPTPDEMETIAKFLGITSVELAGKYMVIERYNEGNYFLKFARKGQEDITGTYPNHERWFDRGYCIFFDKENKACRIHPARPLEARDWNCWDVKPNEVYSNGANAWKADDIYKFVHGFQKSTD